MSLAHQPLLVGLSVLAVCLSAITAAALAVRAGRAPRPSARRIWGLGAAFSLAAGIWSMHFIGMVAIQMPFVLQFEPGLTALSFLPALGAGLGLVWVSTRPRMPWPLEWGAAGLSAAAIVAMHYSGMTAVMVAPRPVYADWSFWLAGLVAFLTSLLAFRFLRAAMASVKAPHWGRLTMIGLTLGLAASGMHYSAMAGTVFLDGTVCAAPASPSQDLTSLSLAFGEHVGLASSIFLILLAVNITGIVVSIFDHRLEDANQKRAEALSLANERLHIKAGQLTDELALEKSIFEAAVDATQDCIWSWQPQTQVLFISPHLNGLLGTDAAYAITSLGELEVRLHPKDLANFRQAFEKTVLSPEGYLHIKVRLRKAHGDWLWVLFRGRMVHGLQGQDTMLVGAISNIEAQQKAEDEARQLAEQQRELAILRSRIVRILSHELKTPLAVITTSTDLLEATSQPRDPRYEKKVGSYFSGILDAVQRIQVILDHALEFNQLESLDAITKPEWCQPLLLCKEAIDWAQQAQTNSPTRITITPGGFEGEAMVDTRLFGLVVQNLLSNAIKYSNGRPVELHLQCAGDLLSIDIIDQGPGIPEAEQAKLFKAFFRGESGMAKPGTGLGLSIAARAAQAMAGELRLVASGPKGSRFRLEITCPMRAIRAPQA
jgi:PAS domain S-box-containing protein